MSSFTRLTLAVATLGAAGCGGASGRSVPVDDFEGDLLTANCDVLVICGAAPDRATCLASLPLHNARFATLRTDVAAGTVAYDGQAAGACIDVFKNTTSCKQTVMGDIRQRVDATCGKVFTGSLPAGGACFFDEECANRGLCRNEICSSNGCCAGTCLARPTPIPLGGDCSNPLADQYCIEGTVCAANAAGGGTCKAPLAAGAPCGPYDRCALPYHCGGSVDPVTNEGTCTAPPARGQACATGEECDDGRDYCDPNYVCTSRIALGDACAAPEECVSYATCDGTMCVAKPGLDDDCGPYPPDRCWLGLSCDTTTMRCALPSEAACR